MGCHADLIKKYTYIDDAYISGLKIKIEYTVNGEKKIKSVSRRTSIDKIQNIIKIIKEQVGEKHETRRENEYFII